MNRVLLPAFVIFSIACGTSALNVRHEINPEWRKQNQIGEISLERNYSGCATCPKIKLILRRIRTDSGYEYTKVTEINRRTNEEREGKIDGYFDNLSRLIEARRFFEMKDGYALGREDAVQVELSVVRGNERKAVRTSNEEEIPLELWAILQAVDGVAAKTIWESKK